MSVKPVNNLLIAEDQALVRGGIAALLEHLVDNVIEVDNGEAALALLQKGNIDICLLDIGLPKLTGLDVLQAVRIREIKTKIIILTGDTNRHAPKDIYAAGADGFLYKTVDAEHFTETFIAVAEGAEIDTEAMSIGTNSQSIAQLRQQLTEREIQIVKLVVEGGTNKTIGQTLSISEHTVRKHREHINQKLKTSTPMSLASFAIKAGLTE